MHRHKKKHLFVVFDTNSIKNQLTNLNPKKANL